MVFLIFSELNNETRLHARNTQRQTDEKKKYNKTAVCSRSQRSRRRRRCFSVVTFSYTFSGLCLLCVYLCMRTCASASAAQNVRNTEREYVAQSKCSDNSTTQHCVKTATAAAAERSRQAKPNLRLCVSVCVLRLYAWECAQQKQQRKKFRLWEIKHIHVCTYVCCMCACGMAGCGYSARASESNNLHNICAAKQSCQITKRCKRSNTNDSLTPSPSCCHWCCCGSVSSATLSSCCLLFMQFCYCLCRGT